MGEKTRLFGIETEYGIQVDDVDDMDVVVESMELIRCYLHENFVARWDYERENPRLDMRGFEVDQLRNDKDETEHLQRDRERKIREIEEAMAAPGFYDDRQAAQPVVNRHESLMWEVGDLMSQWEALQQIDGADADGE